MYLLRLILDHIVLTSPLRCEHHKIKTSGFSWCMIWRCMEKEHQRQGLWRTTQDSICLSLYIWGASRNHNTELCGNTIPIGQIHPAVWKFRPSALLWTQNYLNFAKMPHWIFGLYTVTQPLLVTVSNLSDAGQKLSNALQSFRCVVPTSPLPRVIKSHKPLLLDDAAFSLCHLQKSELQFSFVLCWCSRLLTFPGFSPISGGIHPAPKTYPTALTDYFYLCVS